MPYVIEKVDDGYRVCKRARTVKAKKECLSKQPLNKTNARQQQKALYASEQGGPSSNRNATGAKWTVQANGTTRMMSATSKQLAPIVSQLTGVGASQIIDRLKNGAFHSFPNNVTVSLAGKYKGEGVLDWITKKVGESGLFKSKTDGNTSAGVVNNKIKDAFPADTKTLYQMNTNAYSNTCRSIGEWECVSGNEFVQFYKKANNIIAAVRGTASIGDLMADIRITFQNVQASARFKKDVATIQAFQQQYPQPQYNYYFTGHSLGGALIDEMLKLGLGISAISFNPAVQKEFYSSANHHRIYNTQDPLYDLMGKHVPSAEVRQYKGPEQSAFDRVLSYVPIIGDAQKALKGHSLDNYIGGKMMRITPSVIDRPFMRGGAGPSLYGNGWFEDLTDKVARVAVPALSMGTISYDDIKRGNYTPDISKAPGYILDSGKKLLQLRSGDPSGVIEHVAGAGKISQRAFDTSFKSQKRLPPLPMDGNSGNGRCRWVDKGSRYPDWQEVCD